MAQGFFSQARDYVSEHKAHLPTVALVFGAVFDWITLGRPDSLFANTSLIFYLAVSGVLMLFINRRIEKRKPEKLWMMTLLQFCFGNLASGLLVLYSQSATLVGSWAFILALLAFLIGNEFVKARYARIRAHLIAYHVLLSAYLGLVIPILLKSVNAAVFVLSMTIALLLMIGYMRILHHLATVRVREEWKVTILGFVGVFVMYNALYFFNLIPPVPLSLKYLGIHQSILREEASYKLGGEAPAPWYHIFQWFRPTIHTTLPTSLYCFSSVFAPDNLKAPIYHRWEEYMQNGWITRARISFALNGGRDDGFRGYTLKQVNAGKWRCSVETQGGDLIGRETFTVEAIPNPLPLVYIEK